VIFRGERHVNQVCRRCRRALAHPIKGRLELVHEIGDFGETEHRARSLERVKGAERTVDQRHVVERIAEVEKRLFQLFKHIARLLAKRVREI